MKAHRIAFLIVVVTACTPAVHPATAATEEPALESCANAGHSNLGESELLWRQELAGAIGTPLDAPPCADDAKDERTDFTLDDLGKAIFSTLGVVFTIGLALAPYLLMI